MSEKDFQLTVMDKLTDLAVGQAEIATDMRAVKEHLAKLNSKVAAHEKELSERRNQCPLVDAAEERLRTVEDYVTTQTATKAAEEKTTRAWTEHLLPVARYVVGVVLAVLVILTMNHANLFSFVK